MDIFERTWPPAIPLGPISSGDVHVWRVNVDSPEIQTGRLASYLSEDEAARSGHFHFERDRRRFIVARGLLREVLALYIQKEPRELHFSYNPFGKPALADNESLRFNLSHSAELILIGITCRRDIGIDVEQIHRDLAVESIARRFFTPREVNQLEKLSASNRLAMFYRYWTRKEAYVKAIGEGISFPLERCEVSMIRGRSLEPVVRSWNTRESSPWYVQDLHPGRDYAAAIAVEGSDWNLSCQIKL